MDTSAKHKRDAKDFIALVEQYTNITRLTAELLHTLIDKIVVHEKELADDGEIVMRIEIYYRFIGKVGSMDGADLEVSNAQWTRDLAKQPIPRIFCRKGLQ